MLEIMAICSVTAGGAPTFTSNRGFTSVANGGAGDHTCTLDGGGVDLTQCVCIVNARATPAASGNNSFGVVHTSDTAKQVTSVREAAVGGASTRTNLDFDLLVCRVL